MIEYMNYPFAALEDSIEQLGLLDESSYNLSIDDVDDFVKFLVK